MIPRVLMLITSTHGCSKTINLTSGFLLDWLADPPSGGCPFSFEFTAVPRKECLETKVMSVTQSKMK